MLNRKRQFIDQIINDELKDELRDVQYKRAKYHHDNDTLGLDEIHGELGYGQGDDDALEAGMIDSVPKYREDAQMYRVDTVGLREMRQWQKRTDFGLHLVCPLLHLDERVLGSHYYDDGNDLIDMYSLVGYISFGCFIG
jgi:hypothetical protein